ncbi:MAG: hypothetical protein ACI89L_001788 [Phycisphaerales bacterium]|jgi:hypothetical protein
MRTNNGPGGIVRATSASMRNIMLVTGLAVGLAGPASAQENRANTLPITEVTAFKDGHALIVRSGTVATNAAGDVVLHELPQPLLGTFWADELEAGAQLRAVTSSIIEIDQDFEPGSLPDLLMQNIGARIEFKDIRNHERHGVLLSILQANGERVALIDETENSTGDEADHPGTRIAAIPLNNLRDVRFVGSSPKTTVTRKVSAERMTLDLEWDGAPEAQADISLMAVEHGLRWIPAYRITMLEDDRVLIELEATLVNDLADLEDARVHMAVGVPSFAFAGQTDPMALAERLAALGQVQPTSFDGGVVGYAAGSMLSNSIMSQVSYGGRYEYKEEYESNSYGDSGGTGGAPQAGGSEQAEDLYVFTIEHLTLDRGARMVLPLASYECDAESIYTLDLIAAPPMQAMQNFNTQQQRELAMALDRPTAKHVLRITNDNTLGMPITTAPALILKNGRALAQGLIRYASEGAKADLEVGVAMDLSVKTDETETGRDPDGLNWGGSHFGRINIGFEGSVTNRKDKAIKIEITKLALGHFDSASEGGTGNAINLLSDSSFWAGSAWSRGYSWPWWWHGVNTASRYTWTLEIEPGQSADFAAGWHYFWN